MTKILLILLILLIAAIPRAVELISGNFLWGYDQGLFFEAVKRIVVDHKFTLIGAEVGGAGGFFQGPGWYYLLSMPFFISGGDPYAGMILMFLIGMATVFFSFFLGSKMFDFRTGVFITLLIAISPAIVSQARFIWPPFPISLLTVFLLYFLYRVLQKKQTFFSLATFTAGLMTHFEIATAALVIGNLILLSIILFIKKIISRRNVILAALSFLLSVSPLILFDLRHKFIVSNGLINLVTKGNTPAHEVTLFYFQRMFENHFNVFAYNFKSTFQPDIVNASFLILIIYGSIWYLLNKNISRFNKGFVLYLIISPLLFFGISLLYLWPMWTWWILHISIYYCFLISILFGHMWKSAVLKVIIIVLFTVMIGDYTDKTLSYYKNDLYDYGGTHKIKGKVDVVDYVYNDAKGEKFGVLVFSPPVYTYDVDYLLWWRGERKYKYKPHREKMGLVYLIIEPDPGKPWSYKGWLETVVKDGKVLETKTLKSGMIVQKRIFEHEE